MAFLIYAQLLALAVWYGVPAFAHVPAWLALLPSAFACAYLAVIVVPWPVDRDDTEARH